MGVHDLGFRGETSWQNNDFGIIKPFELVHDELCFVRTQVIQKKNGYRLILSRRICSILPDSSAPMQE